jgi:hypothetical protein
MDMKTPVARAWLNGQNAWVLRERRDERVRFRGYSAATATTATTRGAAQINCAAFGEHELESG